MTYVPTPTTDDLTILAPEFRDFIASFPNTIETATCAETVVKFMRAIPPRPHVEPRVSKRDIQVSVSSGASGPPTTVRLYTPRNGDGPFPVLLWMVRGDMWTNTPG